MTIGFRSATRRRSTNGGSKAVDFEFMQTDKGYVVTGVK
jgi:hypothetical protein